MEMEVSGFLNVRFTVIESVNEAEPSTKLLRAVN